MKVALEGLMLTAMVVTVNGIPLLPIPPTVTATLPVVDPTGTCPVMLVLLHVVGVTVTPFNVKVLVP